MSTSSDGREQKRDDAVTQPSSGEPEESVPDLPNPETGVGIGAGEPSTFEPEEDPDAVQP